MSQSESSSPTALITQLASTNPDERAEAAELLCRAGTEAAAATLPLVEACGDDEEAQRKVGVSWAQRQIRELFEHNAPGVHLYILNKAESAVEVLSALRC